MMRRSRSIARKIPVKNYYQKTKKHKDFYYQNQSHFYFFPMKKITTKPEQNEKTWVFLLPKPSPQPFHLQKAGFSPFRAYSGTK
jgi:hypothetical protein